MIDKDKAFGNGMSKKERERERKREREKGGPESVSREMSFND